MNQSHLANAYAQTHSHTAVVDASPHRQIALLYNKALERISQAKGGIEANNLELKSRSIGRTIDILDALQGWLDLERGGEIAANLDALYDYMVRCLHEANLRNDVNKLNEVGRLIGEIKAGWDGIAQQVSA